MSCSLFSVCWLVTESSDFKATKCRSGGGRKRVRPEHYRQRGLHAEYQVEYLGKYLKLEQLEFKD